MLVLLHEKLDADTFNAAWDGGTKMGLNEAVALALGDGEDAA